MAVPIQTYINIARVTQYLAASGNSKNLLFKGNSSRPSQVALLWICRESIEWLMSVDPNNADLPKQALYMYSLCPPYILEANSILNSGSTGNIINPNTGQDVTVQTPNPQFRVGDPGALMTAGQTMITFNLAGVVNPSLEITLDGVEVPYGDANVFSFTATYNPTSVDVVFNTGVQNGWYLNFHMIQLVAV